MKRQFNLIVILISPLLLLSGLVSNSQEALQQTILEDGFILVDDLSVFKGYINKDNVKVRLYKGNYQIDEATSIRFIEITGNNSHFDLSGCRFMVDTKLFSRTDLTKSDDGNAMYCAIELSGDNVILEGLYIETYETDADKCGCKRYVKSFSLKKLQESSNDENIAFN